MNYLTPDQILQIHSMLVDETGGGHGVRDHGALKSVCELPRQTAFGEELYPTVWIKAAVYARNIITSHPFIDGNKRTGMTAAGVFLEYNGYNWQAKAGEIVDFALEVALNKPNLETIAEWLECRLS